MFIRWRKSWSYWRKTVLVISLLLVSFLSARQLATLNSTVSPGNLTPLSLEGHHRLLILAPHCDDETLGSAGLILAAKRAGIEVRVVIATNGDGYFFATAQDFRKIYPRAKDYIRMGELRQQESLAALKLLGVRSDQVYFLSYPDRGSPSMWNVYWSKDNPYRSPYSLDSKSPYQLTYDQKSVYAGEDYLADVKSILSSYRPDLIVYPHPEDVHPDHWGLNVFTRLAITLLEHSDRTYRQEEYTYLVHRPDFPTIKGLKPQASLVPPPALYALSSDWYRWDLTPVDTALKGQAVGQYKSQLPLLRGLMESFVRANELFAPVINADLSVVAQGDPIDPSTWKDAAGNPILPGQLDPAQDFIVRRAVGGADLVAVYVASDVQKDLLVCSQARDETAPGITYILRIKALTSSGLISYNAGTGGSRSGWHSTRRSGSYVCISVPLAELGNPWAVYVGASTEGLDRVTLDQAGWQMYMR